MQIFINSPEIMCKHFLKTFFWGGGGGGGVKSYFVIMIHLVANLVWFKT